MDLNQAELFIRTNYLNYSLKTMRRFFSKIDVDEHSDCWLWTGGVVSSGYGLFSLSGLTASGGAGAHRVAYLLAVGPIEDGLEVHHKCGVKLCCNPAHLETLSRSSHIDKTPGCVGYINRERAADTHCVHGHEYTPENTAYRYTASKTGRYCKQCRVAQSEAKKIQISALKALQPKQERTHCARGHLWIDENAAFRMANGNKVRVCRICRKEDNDRRPDEQREAFNQKRRNNWAANKTKAAIKQQKYRAKKAFDELFKNA